MLIKPFLKWIVFLCKTVLFYIIFLSLVLVSVVFATNFGWTINEKSSFRQLIIILFIITTTTNYLFHGNKSGK